MSLSRRKNISLQEFRERETVQLYPLLFIIFFIIICFVQPYPLLFIMFFILICFVQLYPLLFSYSLFWFVCWGVWASQIANYSIFMQKQLLTYPHYVKISKNKMRYILHIFKIIWLVVISKTNIVVFYKTKLTPNCHITN